MIVDDNMDVSQTLALLADCGHAITVVHDGLSALTMAGDNALDVILIDIGPPNMDGYELAKRLRANPFTQTKLLAAITGYGQAGDQKPALDARFDQHFTKPVDLDALQMFLGEVEIWT